MSLPPPRPEASHPRIDKAFSDDGTRIETSPKGNRARDVDLSSTAIALLKAQLAWRKEAYARWLPANRPGALDSLDPALGAF